MVRQELVDYIKAQRQKGAGKEDIHKNLLSAGWRAEDINAAFAVVSGINTPVSFYGSNSVSSDHSSSLPGAGVLLGEAWEIYRSKIKIFAGIIVIQFLAVAAVIVLLIVVGLLWGAGSSIFNASAAGFNPPPAIPEPDMSGVLMNIFNWLAGFIIIFLLIGIPAVIIQIWGQAAMIYAIKDSVENISATEAYKRSWHKIKSLFWTGLLSFLIIAGGVMLFAIPGIIFAVWFIFASYIVISEDISGMNALLKSREYIRGRGWEVFGLLLVMFLIWMGISLGVQFGLGIISMILSALGLGIIGFILSLIIWILVALITPFMATYSYLIYKHLKRIKGDFVFAPSSDTKIKYIVVGILGIVLGAGMFLIPFYLVSVMSRAVSPF